MPRRILITGGSGLLAVNWAAARRRDDTVFLGLHHRQVAIDGVTGITLNPDDDSTLAKGIDAAEPDVIIHTAAMTSVNACEDQPDQAMAVNRDLAGRVASLAHQRGIAMIHVSTDHLFDGTAAMVKEETPCQPVNAYGHSKWQGEQAVMEHHPDALVLRVNFFGWGPPYRASFSDWIIASLGAGDGITLYDDVFFTPLYAGEVARAGHALLDSGRSGVYHVTSGERISKHDFGIKLADAFDLDKALITRGAYDTGAGIPRPLDMSLDNTKLMEATKLPPLTIKNSIEALKADLILKEHFSSIESPQ